MELPLIMIVVSRCTRAFVQYVKDQDAKLDRFRSQYFDSDIYEDITQGWTLDDVAQRIYLSSDCLFIHTYNPLLLNCFSYTFATEHFYEERNRRPYRFFQDPSRSAKLNDLGPGDVVAADPLVHLYSKPGVPVSPT